MKFKLLNTLGGWIVFVISSIVYFLTIEPTASLWDCSEFIACAYKLEVGHAPGAPLFLLFGRIFSLFAGNNLENVALFINCLSALASAFSIMFLFWTISLFGKKIIKIKVHSNYIIFGGAFIGALTFTFTDSFWFSAVEGEVYALSSFLTAVVFWAILKWDENYDKPYANRWLLFIAYLIGLSVGVHLLNLLAIPAIAIIYYFKKYKYSIKGLIFTIFLSVFSVYIFTKIFIPGLVKIAAWFDLFMVNGLKLPVHSGTLLFVALLITTFVFMLLYSNRRNKYLLKNVLILLTFIIIGYSTYATIIIRSIANPAIDIGNPDNAFSLIYYLNREQYGSRPLLYGSYYNAPVILKNERYTYVPYEGKYIKEKLNPKYKYDKRFNTIFPRMGDGSEDQANRYQNWVKITGSKIKVKDNQGKFKFLVKPKFYENLAFFFKYQLGYMYLRYFMWNFSGRQNDIQGHGSILNGSWITGINFIDKIRLGPQNDLPDFLKNNKARNKYYLLPFIIGIIGFTYNYKIHKKSFLIISAFFIMMGIALVVYLNEVPYPPRERDYVYTGSFYAFSIWIGMGAMGIIWFLTKKTRNIILSIFGFSILLIIPAIMAKENWDDHDRSGRYIARDLAYNYLNSCDKNAILFTTADNDTYPIWYAQEVEGIRRDIKAILLPFLNSEWYVNHMKRDTYEANGAVISFKREELLEGKRVYLPIISKINKPVDLKSCIGFIKSENIKTKVGNYDTNLMDYVPSKKYSIHVEKQNIIDTGFVDPDEVDQVQNTFEATISGNYLLRSDLIILDIIAQNNWERPVYFLNPIVPQKLGLDKYLLKIGFVYQLLPFNFNQIKSANISERITLKKYELFNEIYKWGGIDNDEIYIDWTTLRTMSLVLRYRQEFSELAKDLIKLGRKKEAIEIMNTCNKLLPQINFPIDIFSPTLTEAYFMAGEIDKANKLADNIVDITEDRLNYYKRFKKKYKNNIDDEIRSNLYTYQRILLVIKTFNNSKFKNLEERFISYYNEFYNDKT